MESNPFWLTKPIAHSGGFYNNQTVFGCSLSAIAIAIEKKYPIEFDVYVLADGGTVVFHHPLDLERLAGVRKDLLELKGEELKQIHFNNSNDTICSLPEVLDFVAERVPLLVEVKFFHRKHRRDGCKIIAEVLQKYQGKYAVQSFDPRIVRWFKKNRPQVGCGLLVSSWKKDIYRPKNFLVRWITAKILLFKYCSPDFININYLDLPYPPLTKILAKRKLPVLAWTISNQVDYDRIKPQVDNIVFENFIPEK